MIQNEIVLQTNNLNSGIYWLKEKIELNKDNIYSKVHKRFIDFYLNHNIIFAQKNRQSGFSSLMKEIAVAESSNNKKVLYLQAGGYSNDKNVTNVDYKSIMKYNPSMLRGRRYDVIIIDEAAFIKNFYQLYQDITVFIPSSKIIIGTTPRKNKEIMELFDKAEIDGNLFHFQKITDKKRITDLMKIYGDNIEGILTDIFGINPDFK